MQRRTLKKITVVILACALSFALAACDNPQLMEMFTAFLAGFTGYNGSAFNQTAGGQGAFGVQLGSQIRQLWMSQSNNTQGGRNLTQGLQSNLLTTRPSSTSTPPQQTTQAPTNSTGGSSWSAPTTDQN